MLTKVTMEAIASRQLSIRVPRMATDPVRIQITSLAPIRVAAPATRAIAERRLGRWGSRLIRPVMPAGPGAGGRLVVASALRASAIVWRRVAGRPDAASRPARRVARSAVAAALAPDRVDLGAEDEQHGADVEEHQRDRDPAEAAVELRIVGEVPDVP